MRQARVSDYTVRQFAEALLAHAVDNGYADDIVRGFEVKPDGRLVIVRESPDAQRPEEAS